MAKRSPDQASENASENTNQPAEPTLWSAEDMARLDEQITAVASVVTELKSRFDTIEHRFLQIEMALSKVNLGGDLLPIEIAKGVDPAQVYTAALQACLLGNFMANPIGTLNEKSLKANVARAFSNAEVCLNEMLRRTQTSRKSAEI